MSWTAQPRPVHWASLTAEEAAEEWDALHRWVERLRTRYPFGVRLPDCWWRHNDLVEVLAALRDFERASFDRSAPATGPVEWQRALRDMELRTESWIKRYPCSVPGREHDTLTDDQRPTPPGWGEFVGQDVERRRRRAEFPTPGPSD